MAETEVKEISRADAYGRAWASAGGFSPGAPGRPVLAPDADEQPRVFDFPPGINLYMTPRGGYGLLPFEQLRNFASLCEEVRIVIESIKREIRALSWDFVPKKSGDKSDYEAEKDQLRAFWESPDGVRDFDSWLNAVLEDMLVIDAASLWIDQDQTGKVVSVDQIDGALIRPLLDARGKPPTPPLPSYVQMVKGMNWQWFTRDRLIYKPFNTNAQTPYGRSPAEFMIIRINQALRRKLSDATYWDSTNVPEALAFLPETWSVEQIVQFQAHFDALLVGDLNKLRRIKFMPSPGNANAVHEFRRPNETTTLDEWMLKLACWCFGFMPGELGLASGEGLGGKGFMEGQENAQYRLGFGPVVQYLESLITRSIAAQTTAPLQFKFVDIGPQEDSVAEWAVLETQLRNGAIDVNVMREKAGQKPIENAKPFMILNGVPVMLDDLFTLTPKSSDVGSDSVVAATPTTATNQGEGAAPDAVIDDVQATALNGAQIASLSEIVQLVSRGILPYDSAIYLIQVAYPTITQELAQKILTPAVGYLPDSANDTDGNSDADTPPEFVKLALDHWHEKVRRRVRDGKLADCEPPAMSKGIIPLALQKHVRDQLVALAKTDALDAISPIFQRLMDPKASGLVPGKLAKAQQPTRGRREIEDGMRAWLDVRADDLVDELDIEDETDVKALAQEGHPFWKTFIALLLPGLITWLARAARHGVKETHTERRFKLPQRLLAGVSWDLVNKNAQTWAAQYAGELISDVADTARQQVRDVLAGWIEGGPPLEELTAKITEIIGDPNRARVISQTESTRAFAEGNTRAWGAAGVEARRWFTVVDESVCPLCSSLHDQVRPIGEPFEDEDGNTYDNPPAHPNCRCYVQPVLELDE